MTEQQTKQQEDSDLGKLLEEALEDLLLEEDLAASDDVEVKGKPNIEESLKKITEVNKAQNTSVNNIQTPKKSKQTKTKQKSPNNDNSAKSSPSTSANDKVVDEEEMNRFFASIAENLKDMPKIDPEEAQAKISESVPQIFDLMQNLLSKELLYPALKDLAPKFDEWLEKNLATLSKDDRRRYKKQVNKIHEIIEVFDDESLDNQERFEKNLELMEQMQALGSPPEELTVPEGMSRCSIM